MQFTRSVCESIQSRVESGESITGIAKELGTHAKSIRKAFKRLGMGTPGKWAPTHLATAVAGWDKPWKRTNHEPCRPAEKPADSADLPRDVQRLVGALRTAPKAFADLCDRLDMSPRKCAALIDRAEGLGVEVSVAHDHIGLQRAAEPTSEIVSVGVDPVVGETQRVAVLSDVHYGSKYCLRDQIREFVGYAYDKGCREVLCPGDMLDGCYRHGVFELTHSGAEAQADDAAENLPQLPGLTYRWISGNHDFTLAEKSGISIGGYIEGRFAEHGRSDVRFYGDRSAFLKVGGAVVHLWHPLGSGNSYAMSYPLQKQLERYARIKPQILLAGHWHRFAHIVQRGVHALACPCFQGGQSAFGRALGGNPTIGGLVLGWQTMATGTIRRFGVEACSYYEDEQIVDVRNHVDGKQIPPTVSRPVAVPQWECCR